jgi:hypothetical protein
MYLLVGDSRELERVLVQQVASLRGELNAGALDQEGVVVLDEEPFGITISSEEKKKRGGGGSVSIVRPVRVSHEVQAGEHSFFELNTQVLPSFFLPGKISRHFELEKSQNRENKRSIR